MNEREPTILFAGGGTGGHISPGLALAEQLRQQNAPHPLLFACSNRDVDARILTAAGERFAVVPASPFSLRPRPFIRFVFGWRRSRLFAAQLLSRESVGLVVALGGFVAAPVVAAARKRKIPTLLVNLDVVPGKANRWLGRHCDRILSAVDTPAFPEFSRECVGLPLRSSALANDTPDECRVRLGLEPNRLTLLITGASQGAQTLNELAPLLAERLRSQLADWQILHLAGLDRTAGIQARYESSGIRARVVPFLDAMGSAWGAADLAISRAGANSVAEAWANETPTILLPYPWHRDRHQYANAEPMARTGGAIILDDLIEASLNAAQLEPILRDLLVSKPKRDTMRSALTACPHRNAAAVIARVIRDQVRRNDVVH